MADKTVSELTPASAVTQSDLFVMEQNGEAKSVTGQVLVKDLAKMLDGHGGIKDIALANSEGLVDTYEVTTADGTVFRYTVTNGEKGPSGTPRNWLDNSYFKYPVNQSGVSSFSGTGRAIDRWVGYDDSSSMQAGPAGVYGWAGTYVQYIPNNEDLLNNTVTIAAKFSGGEVLLATGTIAGGLVLSAYVGEYAAACGMRDSIIRFTITVPLGGSYPIWAALYIGEYTAETLPEYQSKGYAAERLECQRYYRKYGTWQPFATGYVDYLGKLQFILPVSTQFRITPTASALTGVQVVVDGRDYSIPDGVIPRVVNSDANAVHFNLDDQFTLPDHVKQPFVLYTQGTPFTLSAEL